MTSCPTHLPVGDRAVRAEICLRAIGDRLRDLGDLRELFHVDLHAEPGPIVRVQFAVLEIREQRHMRKRPSLNVYSIRTGPENVPRQFTSAAVAMGPVKCGIDADEMRLADRGDLHHLGDAADVGQRGAHVIDVVVLHQLVEVPAVAPLFAGRDRDT